MRSPNSALAQAIRSMCQAALDQGGGRAREVAVRPRDERPELCDLLAPHLIINRWTDLARKQFKEFAVRAHHPSQPALPGFDEGLLELLPTAVAVPQQTGDFLYCPLFGPRPVKEDDLALAIQALESQITADTKRCDALKEYLRYLKATHAIQE